MRAAHRDVHPRMRLLICRILRHALQCAFPHVHASCMYMKTSYAGCDRGDGRIRRWRRRRRRARGSGGPRCRLCGAAAHGEHASGARTAMCIPVCAPIRLMHIRIPPRACFDIPSRMRTVHSTYAYPNAGEACGALGAGAAGTARAGGRQGARAWRYAFAYVVSCI